MSLPAPPSVASPPLPGAPGRSGVRRWPAAIAALSTCVFVAFVSQLPLALLVNAGHDDAWFWLRADRIAAGHWMGEYDAMTLIKGSGYPLFLALVHGLGLSSMTAQAMLYAVACLLLGAAVHRVTGRRWLALLLVLALQWHPAALAWARVLRDAIGAAQVLLVLGCLLHLLHAAKTGRRGWRWAVLAGLALGWLWSTREDGAWVVPGIALLVLIPLAQAWHDRALRRRLVVALGLAAFACGGWLALLATANYAKYGVFATVETRDTGYADAMSALQRVRVGEPVPYLPVKRAVREAVYGVSPSFARLQPYFEGSGKAWTEPGCNQYPGTCGDYAGGWFMWALRDAVASIGEYRSAPSADAFYRQVAADIDAACDARRLTCARFVVPGMPPTAATQWTTLPPRLRRAVAMLLWQRIGEGQVESDVGNPRAREMWAFLGGPRVPDPAVVLLAHEGLALTGIPAEAEARMTYRRIKYWIGQAYARALPLLAVGGLLAFAWATWRTLRQRRWPPLLHVLAAAAWCLVVSRTLFLAIVDMTSFPAVHVHYMQPAFPLLLLAAISSIALLATGARRFAVGRRQRLPSRFRLPGES